MHHRTSRYLFLHLVCLYDVTIGFSIFKERIPNGDKVVDPCDSNEIWTGLGHQNKDGGGLTNPFGQAFKNNNFVWNKTFCMEDSDGDGATNGRELGDPLCLWKFGTSPIFQPLGHPDIASLSSSQEHTSLWCGWSFSVLLKLAQSQANYIACAFHFAKKCTRGARIESDRDLWSIVDGVCEPWSSPFCRRKNANWLNCVNLPVECEHIRMRGVQNMQLRLPPTNVPAQETTYVCVNLEFPSDRDYHVIADTAFVNNSNVLHHMMLQGCSPGVTAAALAHPLGQVYPCSMLAEPELCPDLITGWTPAISGNCHPLEAGYKIGRTGSRYAVLQVMWNNPTMSAGEMDSSGMILFYTSRLRPYNIGTLQVGTKSILIPPGEKGFDIESKCDSSCTRQQLSRPIFILNGYNHMHYAGAEMRIAMRKFREVQDHTITQDIVYDYDNPVIHTLLSPVEIKPRDEIFTSCSYNTMVRNTTTSFGQTPSDEMCLGLLSYYPAEYMSPRHCLSEMGLPQCVLNDQTAFIDRCPVVSFPSSHEATSFMQLLDDNCFPFRCNRECIDVVKRIRTHPCFIGKVKEYTITQIEKIHGLESIARLKSCDVEIARQEGLCKKPVGTSSCFCSDFPMRRVI